MRRSLAMLALLGLVACEQATQPLAPESPSLLLSPSGAGDLIPGRFIVTVDEAVNPLQVAQAYGIRPDFTYDNVLTGFAGNIDDVALLALRGDSRVVRIEQDAWVRAVSTTQTPATWGLDRIDQRALPLDNTYTYASTGQGVTAYIIDTGIRYDHQEFGGRAVFGFDAFDDGQNGNDCQGHGTHVAGTVGGTTYGVAKEARLVAVRVLDCGGSGSFSGIIAGMDWIAGNGRLPAVANMSIGSLIPQRSPTVDAATRNLIASGVTVVMAAGNGVPNGGVGIDACNNAPGGLPEGITVGATDNTDTKTAWSNWGSCVDIFAPGRSITAAWHTSSTATNTISGTSMAAPHVAGVAALYLQQAPGAAPATVKTALIDQSSKDVVQLSLSPNSHLLYSLVEAPQNAPRETGPKPCNPAMQRKGKC
jgi:subtilisin family serine protease